MKRPDKFCLHKINSLTVDTESGKVFRDRKEIKGAGKITIRVRIGFRDKNNRSISFYRSHIVWYAATGKWPTQELDHKNQLRGDDRIDNLEPVSHTENCMRAKRSGLPIGIDKQGSKFRARIVRNGKIINIGRYQSIRKAVTARKNYAQSN